MIRITSLFLLLLLTSISAAQDAGDEDLEAAFDLKIKAEKVGDFEDVVKLCKSAIEKGLDEEGVKEAKTLASSALYEQAEQLMIRIQRLRRGDPTFFRNQAVKLLEEAVEFNPEMGEAWLLIAKLNLLPGGNAEEARSAADRSIGLMDQTPRKQSEAYLLRAMLLQKEDRDSARDDLDKAIELNDSNIGALRARCTIRILEGDVDEGLEDANRIIEVNEGKVPVMVAQGEALSKLADAKAAAAFRMQNASDSEDGDEEPEEDDQDLPKQTPEELESDAKKIREAVLDIYAKVVELAPERDQFRLLKAEIHRELDQTEEALATINELLEKDDRSIMALQQKAQILLADEGNDEETLKVLDLAVKLDPYDMATRRLRMQFFTAREQYSEAIDEAEKIVEKEPNNVGAMDRLALLYSLDEQPKKAIEIYGGLLSRMPMSYIEQIPPRSRPLFLIQKIGTLRSRGDAYLATGEHENAIEDYEEAIDLGDQVEEMQASIGDLGFEYKPNDGVLNNLAWVLSTSTYDDLRDGKRAIELATLACEVTEYKAPHILSTLASGYAETGDFDKAIEWIEKGIELNDNRELSETVTEAEKKRQRESLQKELESYQQNKPWRENQAEEDKAKKEAEGKKKKDDDSDEDDKDDDESTEDEDK